MNQPKTHYGPPASVAPGKRPGWMLGVRILFCSGRAVEFASITSRLDEVSCGACRRKLVAAAKRA